MRKFAFDPYQWQLHGDARWNIESREKRVVYRIVEALSNFLHEFGKGDLHQIQKHLENYYQAGFYEHEICQRRYQNAMLYLNLVQEKQKRLSQ